MGASGTFVYDGACGFCRDWVARWEAITRGRVEYVAYQGLGERLPQLSREACAEAATWVDGEQVSRGAAAVFAALATRRGWAWLLFLYARLPGFAALSEGCYRWVAGHRSLSSAVSRAVWGNVRQPRGRVARWLFLRLLGVVYLVAFASLWSQAEGLLGPRGILPVGEFLEWVRAVVPDPYWQVPTLCWLDGGRATLEGLCGAGTLLSLLLVAGVAPRAVLGLLWICYLSLVSVGQDFLAFQWDGLLLETGLLAVFLAPPGVWTWRWRRSPLPAPAAVWALRLLVAKLMFLSGLAKLTSGDGTWTTLTALDYHFQTQPLPTWLAWYAHHLPAWARQLSVLGTFVVELGLPVLVLLRGRWPRRIAAAGFAGLMLLIMSTGNFGFFNLLTLALCVLLLEDDDLRRLGGWRRRLFGRRPSGGGGPAPCRPAPVLGGLDAALALVVWVTLSGALLLRSEPDLPSPLRTALRAVAPLRSVNRYGLFASMTKRRDEIFFEGSRDGGVTWERYRLPYQVSDPGRRPPFVPFVMPRLDWQMWFAALGQWRSEWFENLLDRLLEGSPPVLALFAHDPFAGQPPQMVRAVAVPYAFAPPGSDAWWVTGEPVVLVTRR